MSAADTGSLYFDAVPAALLETMWRVGATCRPAEFVETVVEVFRTVECVSDEQVFARFRSGRPFRDFGVLLREAAPKRARALAIGCGPGIAGRSSKYAESVVRETCSKGQIAGLDCLDLTPRACPEPQGEYDLVVTHSLLHFFHDLKPICRLLLEALAPGGAYVMANEPNARFWNNPQCVREMKRVGLSESRRKRLRKLTEPSRYWSRLARLGGGEPRERSAEINRQLRDRLNLTGDLSDKEIVRIVDPHLPDQNPGAFAIGSEGLNWSLLEYGPLSGLRLETVRTSGYVMRDNPDQIPARWSALDASLSSLFPFDGCSFSVLWRRPVN